MRAVIQRVSRASVRVEGRRVADVERGLLVLLAVTHGDGLEEARRLADKVAGLRVFADAAGRMNLDLRQVEGAVLVVPQFTLYGDARRGNRPEFTRAARPEHAAPLVEGFCAFLEARGLAVGRGVFGARMEVELVNDGPVTLFLETAGAGDDP